MDKKRLIRVDIIREEINQLLRKGHSQAEIARRLGVTRQAIGARLRYDYKKIGSRLLRDSDRIVDMLNKGVSQKDIAEEIDCTLTGLNLFIKRRLTKTYKLKED